MSTVFTALASILPFRADSEVEQDARVTEAEEPETSDMAVKETTMATKARTIPQSVTKLLGDQYDKRMSLKQIKGALLKRATYKNEQDMDATEEETALADLSVYRREEEEEIKIVAESKQSTPQRPGRQSTTQTPAANAQKGAKKPGRALDTTVKDTKKPEKLIDEKQRKMMMLAFSTSSISSKLRA